jgi:hypothetical protein
MGVLVKGVREVANDTRDRMIDAAMHGLQHHGLAGMSFTEVLAASGAGTEAPRSVRSTGEKPWAMQVSEETLPGAVADAVAELADHEGTLAVLVPHGRLAEVRAAVTGAGDDLTAGPVVLPPEGAKGLEFDSVLVVDPAGIVEEGARGWNDLYVVLTRATQRLGVVHPGPLPPELTGLVAR